MTDAISELKNVQEKLNQSQSLKSVQETQNSQIWTPELVEHLSIGIFAFTILALIIASILLWKNKANATDVLKVFGTIIILGMSTLLLVSGYSDDQLTPIVGLFGAVAGYLLGKESDHKKDSQ